MIEAWFNLAKNGIKKWSDGVIASYVSWWFPDDLMVWQMVFQRRQWDASEITASSGPRQACQDHTLQLHMIENLMWVEPSEHLLLSSYLFFKIFGEQMQNFHFFECSCIRASIAFCILLFLMHQKYQNLAFCMASNKPALASKQEGKRIVSSVPWNLLIAASQIQGTKRQYYFDHPGNLPASSCLWTSWWETQSQGRMVDVDLFLFLSQQCHRPPSCVPQIKRTEESPKPWELKVSCAAW